MWELFTENQISELKRLGFEFRGPTDNPVIKLDDFSISIMSDSISRDESKEKLSFLVWLVIPNKEILCGEFIFMPINASPFDQVLMAIENISDFLTGASTYKKEIDKHLKKLRTGVSSNTV